MKKLADRVNERMESLGLTQEDVAKMIGISQAAVWKITSGETTNPRCIVKLAKALKVTSEWLENGDNKIQEDKPNYINRDANYVLGSFEVWDNSTPLRDDEVELPFFREVELSAGSGRYEVIENHGCKLRFSKSTLKRKGIDAKHAACVTVSGDSMHPVMPDGCVIGIDTANTVIKNGDIYAIDHHGELRVKVLYRLVGGGLRIKSYNDEYPDEMYSQEEVSNIKVLGRMFWCSWLV